jgi:hypothetical protein
LCNQNFPDTLKLQEHLAERHLPTKGDEIQLKVTKKSSAKVEAEKSKPEVKTNQLEALVSFRRKTEPKDSSLNPDKMKDENAVNREIAALLLNLHASRGAPKMGPVISAPVPHPEDLSLKNSSTESAMDLTKSKGTTALTTQLPASITKMVKNHSGVDLSSKNNKAQNQGQMSAAGSAQNLPNFSLPTAPTSYPFYNSLATMAGMSPSLAMNSNYLLQNLLLGKMQQVNVYKNAE